VLPPAPNWIPSSGLGFEIGFFHSIEHANLQLLNGLIAQVLQARTFDKACEFLRLGHVRVL
jgi:hypothetical protein